MRISLNLSHQYRNCVSWCQVETAHLRAPLSQDQKILDLARRILVVVTLMIPLIAIIANTFKFNQQYNTQQAFTGASTIALQTTPTPLPSSTQPLGNNPIHRNPTNNSPPIEPVLTTEAIGDTRLIINRNGSPAVSDVLVISPPPTASLQLIEDSLLQRNSQDDSSQLVEPVLGDIPAIVNPNVPVIRPQRALRPLLIPLHRNPTNNSPPIEPVLTTEDLGDTRLIINRNESPAVSDVLVISPPSPPTASLQLIEDSLLQRNSQDDSSQLVEPVRITQVLGDIPAIVNPNVPVIRPQRALRPLLIPYNPNSDRSPLVRLNRTKLVLNGTLLRIHPSGTPGVNLAGSDREDQIFVENRIRKIHDEVGPYAHTDQSLNAFYERIQRITLSALGAKSDADGRPEKVIAGHMTYKNLMLQRFGKQLTAAIIGAGPIGLAAALTFYQMGYKVICYEKRATSGEGGFDERSQPFSLQRQSYWLLGGLGLSTEGLLKSFGYSVTEREILLAGSKYAAEFGKIASLIMGEAKKDVIGTQAVNYIPGTMSLPVQNIQRLLFEIIKEAIQTTDAEDLTIVHKAECVGCEMTANGRRTLTINSDEGVENVSPDVIYNASGGNINEMMGFETNQIATYYGMGAFFPRPSHPNNLTERKLLSRAVRVFCSYNEEQPVYCNVELDKEEFDSMENFDLSKVSEETKAVEIANRIERGNLPTVIPKVMADVGLMAPDKVFKVQIDLKYVRQAATRTSIDLSEDEDIEPVPQFSFCGGDSILKPHFITASGANFGLLGLIELNQLVNGWLNGNISEDQLVDDYNIMATLLQKQSNQVILELFGTNLVGG